MEINLIVEVVVAVQCSAALGLMGLGAAAVVGGGVAVVVVQPVSAGRPSDDTSTDVSPASIFTADAFRIFDYPLLVNTFLLYFAFCMYSAF